MAYFGTLREATNYIAKNVSNKSYLKNTSLIQKLRAKYYINFVDPDGSAKFHKKLSIEELSGGYFGTIFGSKRRLIGIIALDIDKNQKVTEIKRFKVNNTLAPFDELRSEIDSKEIHYSLLLYAENTTKINNCNKIKAIIHECLDDDYEGFLNKNGFVDFLTNLLIILKHVKVYNLPK